MVFEKAAEIGVSKAVAIEDHDRIATQPRARVPDRAAGAKGHWLDHGFNVRDWMGIQEINNCLCVDAEAEHDAVGAEAVQPS